MSLHTQHGTAAAWCYPCKCCILPAFLSRRKTRVFSMEHCVSNSFVGARKGVGVLCILVLRFNKVQPSLQPQQVLKPVGVASSGDSPGLRADLRWEGCSPLCPPPAQGVHSSASKCCVRPRHVRLFRAWAQSSGVSWSCWAPITPSPALGFVLGALRDQEGESPSDAHELCMNHMKLVQI